MRAGLARAQTGRPDLDPPPPPDERPEPGSPRLSDEALAALFGTLVRYLPDGSTRQYPFDPTGPISTAWLARARRELLFPEADTWWTVGPAHFVRFTNGWVLHTPVLGDRAGWRWLEASDLEPPAPG